MLRELCFDHLPEEARLAASGSFPKLKWGFFPPSLDARVRLAALSPSLALLASPSKPTERHLARDCMDVSPCSVHPFLQLSSLLLFISTLPSHSLLFPILDKHHQPRSCRAPPPHLSHHAPSSAPAPVPGTLSCPMAAVPWFSSLHHLLQFLCLLHCPISSVLTAAVTPGTYRSITTVLLGPTKPEGNHSLLLTGTGVMLPHHLLPTGQWFGDRGKRWL